MSANQVPILLLSMVRPYYTPLPLSPPSQGSGVAHLRIRYCSLETHTPGHFRCSDWPASPRNCTPLHRCRGHSTIPREPAATPVTITTVGQVILSITGSHAHEMPHRPALAVRTAVDPSSPEFRYYYITLSSPQDC